MLDLKTVSYSFFSCHPPKKSILWGHSSGISHFHILKNNFSDSRYASLYKIQLFIIYFKIPYFSTLKSIKLILPNQNNHCKCPLKCCSVLLQKSSNFADFKNPVIVVVLSGAILKSEIRHIKNSLSLCKFMMNKFNT